MARISQAHVPSRKCLPDKAQSLPLCSWRGDLSKGLKSQKHQVELSVQVRLAHIHLYHLHLVEQSGKAGGLLFEHGKHFRGGV
jgi:hypothetical protein